MTEAPVKARRWNAFVCPGCRFLFRVPVEHDGRGVVCSCCRRLLRLPQPGEEVPVPIVETAPGEVPGDPAPGCSVHPGQHAHVRFRLPLWRTMWDGVIRTGGESQGQWLVLSFGALVAFLGIFGMIRLISGGGRRPVESAPIMIDEALPLTMPGELDLSPGQAQAKLGDAIAPATFQSRAEPLARRLADARSVGEMLPLVRDPERNEPLMRDWYDRHGFEDVGILRIAIDGELKIRGRIASLPLLMSDFSNREMEFVVEGDRYSIDWRSWVGWSEMSWTEFVDQRPAEPKLFRVRAQRGNYFNFGFSNESDWRCYELESPDRERLLFGYGRIGSDADDRLAGVEEGQPRALTLRLSFPDGAPAANQVMIDEVVAEGWVVLEDGEAEDR